MNFGCFPRYRVRYTGSGTHFQRIALNPNRTRSPNLSRTRIDTKKWSGPHYIVGHPQPL